MIIIRVPFNFKLINNKQMALIVKCINAQINKLTAYILISFQNTKYINHEYDRCNLMRCRWIQKGYWKKHSAC